MQRFVALTLVVYLFTASGAVAEPVDELQALISTSEFDTLLTLYRGYSSRDDFPEIETSLVELAKEQVVASEYEIALQVLEVVLTVNLFNLAAQDIYVSVNALLKNRVPGSDAPAVVRREPEAAEEATEVASAPIQTAPVAAITSPASSAISETIPAASSDVPPVAEVSAEDSAAEPPIAAAGTEASETSQAPIDSTESIEIAQATPDQDSGSITPETVAGDETPAAVQTADGPDGDAPVTTGEELLPTVEPMAVSRPRAPMIYEAYAGPVSLLGNASGFYSDFYGSGRFNLSYGVSLDAALLFHLPSVALGVELSVDGHFANLTPSGGDQIAYKISGNVGFPAWIDLPLFFRIGFTQQWYLFGTDIPDVLITSFPSPTLGAKVSGIPLGGPVELDVAIDLYAISLFTSYFSLGMDGTVSVDVALPLTEKLSLNPRIGLQPQILLAFGNIEFLTKLELGVGVVSHEP